MPLRPLVIAAFLAAASLGCDNPDTRAKPPASAQPSATTSAAAPAPTPVRFAVEPFGSAVFILKVPVDFFSKDIKGVAKTFAGQLVIDPRDLTQTRGDVAVDLTSLEAHGFGEERLDAEVTGHARDFLEVGKGSLKEPLRFARFTIKSIDEVSDKDVLALSGDKREVTLKATGDLELHGVKQEKHVELGAVFTVAGGVVSRVTVRTTKPFAVSLAAYEIKPRGASGEDLTGKPMGTAGAAHADEVSVSFEVSAKPASAPR